MKVIEAHKFRLYPTLEQEEVLFRTIGCARSVWNQLVSNWNEINSSLAKQEIDKDQAKALYKANKYTAIKNKEEFAYLNEVDSTALKYAQKHFNRACSDYAKGDKGKPDFKARNSSKHSYTTCRAGKNSTNVQLTKLGLKLPKIPGLIKTVVSRNPKGNLVSVTITKERSGKWFASLQYEVNVKDPLPVFASSLEEIKNPGSADLGIAHLLTNLVGEIAENIRVGNKHKKKLARIDRSLSRKREQAKKENRRLSDSKNYQKQKIKRARLHEKIKNTRLDHLHKVTTSLVKTHDFIGVETLNIQGMMKNHSLAFALADASLGEFTALLSYKCAKNGVILQEIGQYEPSTQQCSDCLKITGPKGLQELKIREWTCSACGSVHDRDINAARNILRLALVIFLTENADGMLVEYANDVSYQYVQSLVEEHENFVLSEFQDTGVLPRKVSVR